MPDTFTSTVEGAADYERLHGGHRTPETVPGSLAMIAGRDLFDRIDWRALAMRLLHPTQVRILQAYSSGVTEWTPKGLAAVVEPDVPVAESLPRVSYHVRRLADLHLIEFVRVEQGTRGAVRHFYRLTEGLMP